MIKPRPRSVVVLVTVLLLGLVVGGVGFVLGRDSAEPDQAPSAARSAQTEQVAAARKAGYERGFAAGRRAAARRAAEAGSGASGDDALAVSDFDLQPGYYVVRVAGDGPEARVDDYAPMEPGISYALCDAYGVCRRGR